MLCGTFNRKFRFETRGSNANDRFSDFAEVPPPQWEKHDMGLMPDGGNPFTKLDKQSVIGTLKATGSRDADILHAQKQKLLAPAKNLKILAIIMIVGGALLTITVILAIAGIPFALFGVWLWRFSSKNIAAVEAGYTEYLASTQA